MYGVVQGAWIRNVGKDEEINKRLFARNVPSATLQPSYGIRPVSTKYGALDIIDRRVPASVPIEKLPTYNIATTFNPGTSQAPWSGFATAIDVESSLRSQFFALQSCEQSEFVPSSTSEMYSASLGKGEKRQPPRSSRVYDGPAGKDSFHNHTRQQRS